VNLFSEESMAEIQIVTLWGSSYSVQLVCKFPVVMVYDDVAGIAGW